VGGVGADAVGDEVLGIINSVIGLLVLAFVAKAACDNLTHQAGNSIFEKWGAWFDTRVSWLNKYKPGSWPTAPVPRFPGSTTVFAWATDFWHAADSVYLTAYLVGAMLLGAWLGAVALGAGGGCGEGRRWWRVSGVIPAISD
jgi:hypothetical protein